MSRRRAAVVAACALVGALVVSLWVWHSAPRPISRPTQSGFPGGGTAGPTLDPGSGRVASTAPTVFAYGGAQDPSRVVSSLPNEVRGVSWTFRWKDIEPQMGTYNWAPIDNALAAAAAGGRVSMLRVIPGSASPSWVQPAVSFFDTPRGPVAPHQVTMPVPWSSQFLSAFTGFVAAYGARYDQHPGIYTIQMAGAGILGEMAIGRWQLPGGGSGWTAPPSGGAGATDSDFVTAWNTIIDAYRAAFPHLPTALDIGDPLGDGKVLPQVLAHAQQYGTAVRVQENGLGHAGSSIQDTIRSSSARTTVGWQMWGGHQSQGQLAQAFATAVATHATYVEVYQNDCANPANLSAIRSLASGLVSGLA